MSRAHTVVSDPRERRRWLTLATYASVLTATLLIVLKTVAWLYTGSASLLGSLVDSLMDAMASLINLLAVRYSLKPPDREHRFGHGKAESIAAVAQAAFILGSAVLLTLYTVERWLAGAGIPSGHGMLGMAVIVFSLVMTLLLVGLQRVAVRKTGSPAIHADSLHYRGDVLMNGGVLVALVMAEWGWYTVDRVFALLIAGYLAFGAVRIGQRALHDLMDHELPDEVKQRIIALALDDERILGVHELRTRQSGGQYIIQLHLEMDDDMPLFEAHTIADAAEDRLREAFPGADVLIHQDPHSIAPTEHA